MSTRVSAAEIKRDIMNQLEKRIELIKTQAAAACRQGLLNSKPDIIELVAQKGQQIFEETVDEGEVAGFYTDYIPNKYRRNYSMRDILDIEEDNGWVWFNWDEAAMTSTDKKEYDDLAGLTYEGGWHGGPVGRGKRGLPVKIMSPSPYKIFTEKINKYESGEDFANSISRILYKNKIAAINELSR